MPSKSRGCVPDAIDILAMKPSTRVITTDSFNSGMTDSGTTTPDSTDSISPFQSTDEDDGESLLTSLQSMSFDDAADDTSTSSCASPEFKTHSVLLMDSLSFRPVDPAPSAVLTLPPVASPKAMPKMSVNAKEFTPGLAGLRSQGSGGLLPSLPFAAGLGANSVRDQVLSSPALPPSPPFYKFGSPSPASAPTLMASQLRGSKKFQLGSLRSERCVQPAPSAAISVGPPIRQLPCKTWLSTGTCPYSSRCVFLHDARCVAAPVSFSCKRKSREDPTTDGLFWPTLTKEAVCAQLDKRGQPCIYQEYVVPSPLETDLMCLIMTPPPAVLSENFERHQWCTYSTWNHFLDFLAVDEHSAVSAERCVSALTFDATETTNQHTHKPRLPIFAALSRCPLQEEHSPDPSPNPTSASLPPLLSPPSSQPALCSIW